MEDDDTRTLAGRWWSSWNSGSHLQQPSFPSPDGWTHPQPASSGPFLLNFLYTSLSHKTCFQVIANAQQQALLANGGRPAGQQQPNPAAPQHHQSSQQQVLGGLPAQQQGLGGAVPGQQSLGAGSMGQPGLGANQARQPGGPTGLGQQFPNQLSGPYGGHMQVKLALINANINLCAEHWSRPSLLQTTCIFTHFQTNESHGSQAHAAIISPPSLAILVSPFKAPQDHRLNSVIK